MNKIFQTIVLWFFMSGLLADEAIDPAINNYAHEIAECAAFYFIAGQCSSQVDSQVSEQSLVDAGELLARSIELTDEALGKTRFEMARKQINGEMGDCSRGTIILYKYGEKCKFAAENPDEWIENWRKES